MRAFLLLPLALGLAAAQPRRSRHHHRHDHAKRDMVIETQVAWVTAEAAASVIVYVDQAGNTISISTGPIAEPTLISVSSSSTSAPPAVVTSTSVSVFVPQAQPSSAAHDPPGQVASPSPTPAASSTPERPPPVAVAAFTPAAPKAPAAPAISADDNSVSVASANNGAGIAAALANAYGIGYSPYYANKECKPYNQVDIDISRLPDYGFIRSYGIDCNQAYNILKAAKKYGRKVMLGVYDIENVNQETQQVIDAAKVNGGWDGVDTVVVGNEHVNSGKATPGAVVDAVNQARDKLKAAGFGGHVVTVDTFNAIIAHPELCQVSDYAAANCHAFFDSNTAAQDAGAFVATQRSRLQQACGNKAVVITESGWPKAGQTNGKAVPGTQQQQDALNSLRSHFGNSLVFFSAYDDEWKSDFQGSFEAEKHWGIH